MGFELDSHSRISSKELRNRILVAMAVVFVVFCVLVTRLYTLQITRGEELARRGQENIVQHVVIRHDRGIIYDRQGRILVDNRPTVDVQLTPAFLGGSDQIEETLRRLGLHVGFSSEEISALRERISQSQGLRRFRPILVRRDLNRSEVEKIEADRSMFELDGVETVDGRRRVYRYGRTAAHVLGYVNEIDRRALERERNSGNPLRYKLGDLIGRDGVEWTHESELRGTDGYSKVVVDAKGRRLRDDLINELLGLEHEVSAKPGHNVVLTLDIELQRAAETKFAELGVAGAVVALDPRTGAILAMVSAPEFDPNKIAGAEAFAYKQELDADPLKPWINRPIQGQYAPGSTFKAFTALASLQEGAMTPRDKVFAPGSFRLGRHTWRCHKDSGHGYVDLKTALKVSCDVYFYTAAHRIGIDPIADMAKKFGFGSRTGIDLRNEKRGIVPNEAWHDQVDAATGGYQRGMAINTSIGQGALLVTPIQLAVAYAALVNGGRILVPQTVRRVETADFRVVHRYLPGGSRTSTVHGSPFEPGSSRSVATQVTGATPVVRRSLSARERRSIKVAVEHFDAVRAGLVAVAQEPGGTAYWRRSRVVTMGGKTGTAQVVRLGKNRLKAEEETYFFRDHAWFASFAPSDDPEIVVVAINEHSGHGSSKAAPIAVAVIDKYFEIAKQSTVADSKGPL